MVELVDVVVGATVVAGLGMLVVVAVVEVVVDEVSVTAPESLAHAAIVNDIARTRLDRHFIVC